MNLIKNIMINKVNYTIIWRGCQCVFRDFFKINMEVKKRRLILKNQKGIAMRLCLFGWLGWPDLNRRMPESKSGALP
ncbi:MAG: hypothetical protein IIX15_00035, partial [Clostridia bacterium]|nr:hypothetical protein [Clostridia bacterium]